MQTEGDKLVLRKAKSIAKLRRAKTRVIFQPPAGTSYSRNLWAPEIHFINNQWYVYFAADDGKNENHRLYVLQNSSMDPFAGEWSFQGKIADDSNRWAIDGSVFNYNDTLYMVWSGWEGDTNGQQDIYISRLKDPVTIDGRRIRISSPQYEWEKQGTLNDPNNPPLVTVNEGPQFLAGKDKLFIIYSASGCWTDRYGLGMLWATKGSNLLDSLSWKKHDQPVFETNTKNNVFAPGHNSFFKSPDSTEDWILYHANDKPGLGCGRNRTPRAQKFEWNSDGTPNFGQPVDTGRKLAVPSRRKKTENKTKNK